MGPERTNNSNGCQLPLDSGPDARRITNHQSPITSAGRRLEAWSTHCTTTRAGTLMTEKSNSYGSPPTGISGMLWFAGWLFTIGYLKLGFWKGVLGLVVWPYFLGTSLTA
jgi:hypothetical protein